ncbi:hypothetical protein BU072_11635 [Mammaliicoccus vitulinus]|uniref:Uncharacterized protein n=1 Tax=Mammaliicoccus vitulinus TaxID=71237 RepID=A0A2T4PR09_9STAP|nr:hypothetical protein BU072_11635 [Mammaliicoccus vitulinus]RIN20620.1 hypothetical protein BU070_11495 [Mammaliicoccus vitulinus]
MFSPRYNYYTRCNYNTKMKIVNIYISKSYDFESACLPGGMVRACSLSLILFPRASALHKIVSNI